MPYTEELKAGGSEIPVTNANRREYCDLYARHVLVNSVKTQVTLPCGSGVCASPPPRLGGWLPSLQGDRHSPFSFSFFFYFTRCVPITPPLFFCPLRDRSAV